MFISSPFARSFPAAVFSPIILKMHISRLLGNYSFKEAVLHFVGLNDQTEDHAENPKQLKLKLKTFGIQHLLKKKEKIIKKRFFSFFIYAVN